MKNSDQHIIHLLRQKLELHESAVDPGLWSGIESSLAPATATVVAAKTGMVVLKWIAATVIVATSVVVVYNLISPSEKTAEIKTELPAEVAGPETTTESTVIKEEPVNQTSQLATDAVTKNPANQDAQSGPDSEKDELNPIIQSPGIIPPQNPIVNPASTPPPPVKDESELRGTPKVTSTPRNVDALFEVVRVSDDELKFFFFPHFPDESKYTWRVGDNEISHDISASHTFEEGDHSVTLTITSQKGEVVTYTTIVEAWYPAILVVPNVFSPNNDDKNKCLDVMAKSQNIEVEQISIFDRNGQAIFTSSPGNTCWDGNDRYGNPTDAGTYLWVTRFHDHRGKVLEQKGTLTLLRN